MRLELSNFGCYEKKTFEFDDGPGIELIHGESGVGKSTIQQAIQFAIYGKCNMSKIVHFGHDSCTVVFIYEDTHIVRSSKPKKLVLNHTHKGEIAQAMIDKEFEQFENISVCPQNSLKSFLMRTPSDKLEFLECLTSSTATEYKTKIKLEIGKRKDELHNTQATLDGALGMIEVFPEPINMEFPLEHNGKPIRTTKNMQTCIKNEQTRFNKSERLEQKLEKELFELDREIQCIKSLKMEQTIKQDSIETYEERISNLDIDQSKYIGNESLATLEDQLEHIIQNRESIELLAKIEKDTDTFETMKRDEMEILSQRITELESNLNEYPLAELQEDIADRLELKQNLEQIETLKTELLKHTVDKKILFAEEQELSESQKILDSLLSQQSILKKQQSNYHCPSCNATVRLTENDLVLSEDFPHIDTSLTLSTVEADIKNLQNQIKELQKMLCLHNQSILDRDCIQKNMNAIYSKYDDISDLLSVTTELAELKEYQQSTTNQSKRTRGSIIKAN